MPVRELIAPLAAAVKAVPVVSFIILALVWVDGGSLSLLISGLMAFPPIYGNVLEGIAQTDRQLWGVWTPAVLPYFRSAVSLAIGLCWKSGVAAEVIGLRTGTVGERLYAAKVYFQTADLFAWTAVIVALSVVMERLILRGVDALTGKVGIR